MSTDRDTTRIVRSWLEEGATALPDRVLDAVLDQVPTTRQRRARWPAWLFRLMAILGLTSLEGLIPTDRTRQRNAYGRVRGGHRHARIVANGPSRPRWSRWSVDVAFVVLQPKAAPTRRRVAELPAQPAPATAARCRHPPRPVQRGLLATGNAVAVAAGVRYTCASPTQRRGASVGAYNDAGPAGERDDDRKQTPGRRLGSDQRGDRDRRRVAITPAR